MKYKATFEIELEEDLLGLNEYMKENPDCPDKLSALKYMLAYHYTIFDVYDNSFDETNITNLIEVN